MVVVFYVYRILTPATSNQTRLSQFPLMSHENQSNETVRYPRVDPFQGVTQVVTSPYACYKVSGLAEN